MAETEVRTPSHNHGYPTVDPLKRATGGKDRPGAGADIIAHGYRTADPLKRVNAD